MITLICCGEKHEPEQDIYYCNGHSAPVTKLLLVGDAEPGEDRRDSEEPEKRDAHAEQDLEDPQTREEVEQHVGRQQRLGMALVQPLGVSHYYSVWHSSGCPVWQLARGSASAGVRATERSRDAS